MDAGRLFSASDVWLTHTRRRTSLFTSQLRLRTQAWRTTLNSCGCLGCWWLRKRIPVSSSMLINPGWDAGRDRHPCEASERDGRQDCELTSGPRCPGWSVITKKTGGKKGGSVQMEAGIQHLLSSHWCCGLTSHISPLCVAELLALMVSPSPSRSPSLSLSLSPGTGAPAWDEGDGGCSASVQNNVRGPWSSQKWQRATRAFIWKGDSVFVGLDVSVNRQLRAICVCLVGRKLNVRHSW